MRERKTSVLGLYVQLVKLYILIRLAKDSGTIKRYHEEIIEIKKVLKKKHLVPGFASTFLQKYHYLRTVIYYRYYYHNFAGLLSREGCETYLTLKKQNLKQPTVLLIEPNNGHGQVAEAVANYLVKLGLAVNLVVPVEMKKEKLAEFVEKKPVQVFYFSPFWLRLFLKSKKIAQYELVFFNSMSMWLRYKIWLNTARFLQINYPAKRGVWGISHKLAEVKNDKKYLKHDFVLGDFSALAKTGAQFLPTIGYGDYVRQKIGRSQKIKLAMIGGSDDPTRRNGEKLHEALATLKKQKIVDFELITAGSNKDSFLPYPDLYKTLSSADFIVFLLDPKTQEVYKTGKITGNYLDAYSFSKPAIIHREFAKLYGFDESSALIFDDKISLAEAIKKAIKISAQDYEKMVSKVEKQKEKLEEIALEKLRYCLKNEKR